MLEPQSEIDILLHKSTNRITEILINIALAWIKGDISAQQHLNELTDALQKSQGIADMLGRKRIILEDARVVKRDGDKELFFDDEINARRFTIDRALDVEFSEAIDAIADSNELLKAQKPADDVIIHHTRQKLLPRVNKAATDVIQRVNAVIVSDIAGGEPAKSVEAIREIIKPWARARAETIYRTNINQAYTAGRFRQVLQDPNILERMPAFIFEAVDDPNVRPMHFAHNQKIYLVNDPIWEMLAPPIHYNCRCSVRSVSVATLRSMGRIDSVNQFVPERTIPPIPTPNFGRRPDRTIYSLL